MALASNDRRRYVRQHVTSYLQDSFTRYLKVEIDEMLFQLRAEYGIFEDETWNELMDQGLIDRGYTYPMYKETLSG